MISPTKRAETVLVDGLPGQRAQFTIKMNEKAFRTLIDTMYENKIGAVVREIMSNGYDSHAAAGCLDKPIKVTAPTALDPVFRVRDFGVSMDHDTIMTVYSTLFESTKEDTNDQVGQFGLGSKTPFAYGDSFSITAWLDGEKRVYIAHVGDGGIPSITHISTEPQADEPQGVEITVAAKLGDISRFNLEIARMALASDVKPEIDGMDLPNDAIVYEGKGFRVVRNQWSLGEVAVRQGCVMYPVHSRSAQMIHNGYTLVVDVPIGSVDVTASREALSLTPATETVVRQHIEYADNALKAYRDEINASFPNKLAAFRGQHEHQWLRASIGISSIPLTMDAGFRKQNLPGQAINHRHTKTKDRLVYNVQNPESWMLLVDSGDKMPRRQLRLAQFWERNRNRSVGIISREDLPRIARLTGIAPTQVMTLQAIPDVPVAARVSGSPAPGGVSAPKSFPKGAFWLRKTGVSGINRRIGGLKIESARDLFEGRQTSGYYGTYICYSGQLKDLGFIKDDVVFLTDRQAEELKAPASQDFEAELLKRAQNYANKHKLQDKLDAISSRESFNRNADFSSIQSKVVSSLGLGNQYYGYQTFPSQLASYIQRQLQSEIAVDKGAELTNTEKFVVALLQMEGIPDPDLTSAKIQSKVTTMALPFKAVAKANDPFATLIEFYNNNQ